MVVAKQYCYGGIIVAPLFSLAVFVAFDSIDRYIAIAYSGLRGNGHEDLPPVATKTGTSSLIYINRERSIQVT